MHADLTNHDIFSCVTRIIVEYNLHADYSQKKQQYTLHSVTLHVNSICAIYAHMLLSQIGSRHNLCIDCKRAQWGTFLVPYFSFLREAMTLEMKTKYPNQSQSYNVKERP